MTLQSVQVVIRDDGSRVYIRNGLSARRLREGVFRISRDGWKGISRTHLTVMMDEPWGADKVSTYVEVEGRVRRVSINQWFATMSRDRFFVNVKMYRIPDVVGRPKTRRAKLEAAAAQRGSMVLADAGFQAVFTFPKE